MRNSGFLAIGHLRETRSPHVLLVEDDDDLRALLAMVLRSDGCEVFESPEGAGACTLIAQHAGEGSPVAPFDLVVCDLLMPGGSGIDVLQCLQAAGWRLPVIVVTATQDEALWASARRLGAAALFRKPFELDDLRLAVLNLLPQSKYSSPEDRYHLARS